MAALVLTGDTSGTITLQPPAVAGTTTLTLPATTGTIITTGDTGSITPAMLTQKLTRDAVKASTSGTTVDFTGIPSWARRITIMLAGVSTNGSSNPQIQLGDAGGFETTGYLSAHTSIVNSTVTTTNVTTGFAFGSAASTNIIHGIVTLTNLTGNTWAASGMIGNSSATFLFITSGSKDLSDTLTQVRITTVNGTDTFDAGNINILYEG